MVALDQRPPLFEAIAQAKGITRDQVAYADVTSAKRLLVEALAPHCSSMLFDPNFAVPAAIDLLPPRCGLIMTLEEHRVEETPGGRKSRAIANWSVEKIRAIGGDAVKVLAWYRPDADSRGHRRIRRTSCARSARTARASIFPMCWSCWSIRSSAAPTTPPITWNRRASCRRS